MNFVISAILKPRFFVLCYTTNKGLNPAAEKYARQRAIDVVVKDQNLDFMFNLVGICSGCAAFILAVALLIFYQRKRNETKGAAAGQGQ
ncbi:hypothetical protein V1264_021037 [Littorina saxatilis]|uniref:Uncharacterized protein n=2 Tax=Littorina saxatilis TaxID=31220 RepID=A0AAN9BDU9_9CAEN